MRIAVIGSGGMGSAIARSWSELGHSVVIGTRTPDSKRVTSLVRKIGHGVVAASLNNSIEEADVIVLAVPWIAAKQSIVCLGDLKGRVIIDVTNPFLEGLNLEIGHVDSGGEQISRWSSGAHVVKALNIVDARLIGVTSGDDRKITIPICGDDQNSKRLAIDLISHLGFDVIDAGKLKMSRLLEPLSLLMIKLSMRKEFGSEIGFRLLRN